MQLKLSHCSRKLLRMFPWIKQNLKGRCFADVAEVQQKLLVVLECIFVENFIQNFQQVEQCWDRCIQSQGEYFEGDLSLN